MSDRLADWSTTLPGQPGQMCEYKADGTLACYDIGRTSPIYAPPSGRRIQTMSKKEHAPLVRVEKEPFCDVCTQVPGPAF